jgi:chaperone BCS1
LKGKNKKLQFTPSFGSHYFWYKGKPFVFNMTQDRSQNAWGTVSERENICQEEKEKEEKEQVERGVG